MPETIACPSCRSTLQLPSMPAGQTVQCPRCQHVFEPTSPHVKTPAPPPVRYDDEDAIDPVLARMTCPAPLAGEWKAIVAMFALAASVLSFMVAAYLDYERIDFLETEIALGLPNHRIGERRFVPRPRVAPNRIAAFHQRRLHWERISEWSALLGRLTWWPALVLFLVWLHQATKTAHAVRPEFFTHAPGRAVGSFFVPILNLFWPYTIMQDVWRACDPREVDGERQWKHMPRSNFLRGWWLCWLAYLGLSVFSFWLNARMTARDELEAATLACFAHIAVAIAGLLLIAAIRGIARRQHERYIRLYENPA